MTLHLMRMPTSAAAPATWCARDAGDGATALTTDPLRVDCDGCLVAMQKAWVLLKRWREGGR